MTALVALLLAAGCGECHRAEAQAFEASRHAHAFELPVFVLPFQRASSGWCLGCHRPEGIGTVGLTCASCHGVEGHFSAVRENEVCARCHQFDAPDSGEPLQNTVVEAGGRACSSCHDPHAAPGAHDLPTLASAIAFAANETDGGVEVRVTARAGHRFPTGDPFRRLVVSVCDDRECASPLARRTLSKGFASVGGEWKKLRDFSLGDGEATVLKFPAGRFWRASYDYGDPAFEASLAPEEVSVEVGRGEVSFKRRPE